MRDGSRIAEHHSPPESPCVPPTRPDHAAAGKTGQIIITGMNATGPARAAVDSGGLALTVQLKPLEWGRLAVDSMAKWLGGDHTFEAPRPGFSLIEKQ